MNRTEYLLTVVAEECAEIAQRAAKAARFGMDQVQNHPTENPDRLRNSTRITVEWNDLLAVLEMLDLAEPIPELIAAKKAKVEAYMTAGPAKADADRLRCLNPQCGLPGRKPGQMICGDCQLMIEIMRDDELERLHPWLLEWKRQAK